MSIKIRVNFEVREYMTDAGDNKTASMVCKCLDYAFEQVFIQKH